MRPDTKPLADAEDGGEDLASLVAGQGTLELLVHAARGGWVQRAGNAADFFRARACRQASPGMYYSCGIPVPQIKNELRRFKQPEN